YSFFLLLRRPLGSPLFPYTTLFRSGIQQGILAAGPMVAAKESLAPAPASAADNHPVSRRLRLPCVALRGACRFRHKIGAVGDELAVDAKNGLQRAFDLRESVVFGLQAASGGFD